MNGVFEGFRTFDINVNDVTLHGHVGGQGPAILLVHGHPRTHATWHMVAAELAGDFTVVCADTRGYGRSSKPALRTDHIQMSKRQIASDLVHLMAEMGNESWIQVGHDRGAYASFRLAMDHPERVSKLVMMDAIPIGDVLRLAGTNFATAWWHWFFFAQDQHPADTIISRDPIGWYGGSSEHMGEEAFHDYRAAIENPETVTAMMEDYRAGLGIDRVHDDQDREDGRRLTCPVLFVRAEHDDMADLYDDPKGIWQTWSDRVEEVVLDCGHHMAEEAPGDLASAIRQFAMS